MIPSFRIKSLSITILLCSLAILSFTGCKQAETLHDAAAIGSVTQVKVMLFRVTDIDEKNKAGETALHVAAAHGHRDVVEFLLSKGSAINALDNNKKTALARAREGGHSEVADFIVSKGGK